MPSEAVHHDVQPTSTWRVEFRRAEMKFFNIPMEKWRSSAGRKLKSLHQNYARIHDLHVAWLNQRLPLATLLTQGDFDGDITPLNLRDFVIAGKIRPEPMMRVRLDAGEEALTELGLGHLVPGSGGSGRDA